MGDNESIFKAAFANQKAAPEPENSESKQSFLACLAPEDRQHLAQHLHRSYYSEGSVLFREGESGDTLHIIWKGKLAVVKEEMDGRFTLLAYRGPGEIIGEMSAISGRPRSASIIAVENTELLSIDGETLQALTTDHPTISKAILDVLTDRLRVSDDERVRVIQREGDLSRQLSALAVKAEQDTQLQQLRQETMDLIVHDLRNPLSVVRTALQLLSSTLPPEVLEAQSELLATAHRSTNRLLEMVESLLAAARQEQDGIPLTRQETAIGELLEAAVESVRPMATERDIALNRDVAAALPRFSLDPEMIRRVVTNLLDNALAYTPEGGSVTLAVKQQEGALWVSVTDTGPGVPEAYREQIFERFGRVPAQEASGRRRKGFGLGLYFCRQVITSHGGRIWMEPGPGGVGSRFIFTLPR